jgi:hypothetical protein
MSVKLFWRDTFGSQIAPANPHSPPVGFYTLVVVAKNGMSVVLRVGFQVLRTHDGISVEGELSFPPVRVSAGQ